MVKRLIPLVSLSIVLFVAGAALAKPDLIVTDIALTPQSPVAGEVVTVTATVENAGTSDAGGRFNVRFLVDGFQIDAPSVPFGLDAGRTKSLSFDWRAEVGVHTISVEADQPFNRIDESNENNNTLALTVAVPIDPSTMSHLADLKVAVARFEDRSGSGFINVGEGVADELVERLVRSGVRILERSELEAVMQERGLNPAITEDLTRAGQLLGADLLIVGSVTKVNVQQTSVSLGFFSVSSASVEVSMSARLVNVYTSEIMSAVSVSGSAEGATGFSVDIGKIVSLSQPTSMNVCTGGLRTDKPYYYTGETVHIGYKNAGVPGWYGVEIHTDGGAFLKWLDWQFISAGNCGEWFWDQRDAANVQMSPGIYTAKLWDGSSYIASTTFQIKPGGGPAIPLVDEITVGSGQFDETIVGKATNNTLDQLVARLIQGMGDVAPAVIAARGSVPLMMSAQKTREGQIAAILPDGRVVINIGASDGVSKGDFFQILDITNLIVDPNTGEILAYDLLEVKGEIVITEVRDQVSYGVRTTDFIPLIGDIARPEAP
jgi:hypothetical protein